MVIAQRGAGRIETAGTVNAGAGSYRAGVRSLVLAALGPPSHPTPLARPGSGKVIATGAS